MLFLADSDQLGHSLSSQQSDAVAPMEVSGVLPDPDAQVGNASILSEGTVLDLLLGPAAEPELAEITTSLIDVSIESNDGPLVIDESETDVSREL